MRLMSNTVYFLSYMHTMGQSAGHACGARAGGMMLELSWISFSNLERVFAKTCPFTPSSLPVNETNAASSEPIAPARSRHESRYAARGSSAAAAASEAFEGRMPARADVLPGGEEAISRSVWQQRTSVQPADFANRFAPANGLPELRKPEAPPSRVIAVSPAGGGRLRVAG